MKLLIADDSELLRKSLRKLLCDVKGISEVYESESVADTLQQLAKVRPDILLLDIQMPDGSGFDVLRTKKTTPKLTIVLTNFPTDSNRRKSLSLGADYFFDKSNEYEKLIGVFESL
ncbi:MAG: response regulator [Spirochaetaceae bacterium]|nr:response regulator [Spirochaetaceae bacterium]MCF7947361.1 response regulator [Spirochaetia bacterium]MCF7950297.1 response regulator [Spirochaetaceae bacterium]